MLFSKRLAAINESRPPVLYFSAISKANIIVETVIFKILTFSELIIATNLF